MSIALNPKLDKFDCAGKCDITRRVYALQTNGGAFIERVHGQWNACQRFVAVVDLERFDGSAFIEIESLYSVIRITRIVHVPVNIDVDATWHNREHGTVSFPEIRDLAGLSIERTGFVIII